MPLSAVWAPPGLRPTADQAAKAALDDVTYDIIHAKLGLKLQMDNGCFSFSLPFPHFTNAKASSGPSGGIQDPAHYSGPGRELQACQHGAKETVDRWLHPAALE